MRRANFYVRINGLTNLNCRKASNLYIFVDRSAYFIYQLFDFLMKVLYFFSLMQKITQPLKKT